MTPRLRLAHLPTPLEHYPALDALVGTEVWIKRDDITGGADAGNKLRKLEFLLADARQRRATTVITCGGAQSNHARATALSAARLRMRAVLLLRNAEPFVPQDATGNLFLDRLVGAEVRRITPEQYSDRARLMGDVAAELTAAGETPYVIAEGGSSGRGALGYVAAMREVRQQLDLGLVGLRRRFDAVVVACGSGGTAAGVALGAAAYDVAPVVHAMAVCDDVAYFQVLIERIAAEARSIEVDLPSAARVEIHDRWRGPAYGVAGPEQQRFLIDVARASGLVLDPVYSGKALFALAELQPKPSSVLFVHTGGLPGLLAQAATLAPSL